MARYVQTTARTTEAALKNANDLIQQGYQQSELVFVVDENAAEDGSVLENEGIQVQYVKTREDSAWEAVKEAISLDNASNTVDDAPLDAYKEDLMNGHILIVIDSARVV